MTVQVQTRAPEFEAISIGGQPVQLSQHFGQKVLLLFSQSLKSNFLHPAAEIMDYNMDLSEQNLTVFVFVGNDAAPLDLIDKMVGISPVVVEDSDMTVSRDWGVVVEKSKGDHTVSRIKDSAFVVDEGGKVVAAWQGLTLLETLQKTASAIKGIYSECAPSPY